MSRLLVKEQVTASGAQSALRFSRAGGGQWAEWDRYLELDGRRAYHLGNICNTCEFAFQRLEGANRSVTVAAVAEQLAAGLRHLPGDLLDTIGAVLPAGPYHALLLQGTPQLTRPGATDDYFAQDQVATWDVDSFWGLPHDPRTEYYRLPTVSLGQRRVLYEFLVPMHPHGWLQTEVVARYSAQLAQGGRPTVLALSVLDVKGPAAWDEPLAVTEHWCLAHYLLDGHHKAYAATQALRPISMLSLLATGEGISSPEQISEMQEALQSADA